MNIPSAEGKLTIPSPEKLTPLMKQFWDIKRDHMDKILLFRMGDFYEMFHQDAEVAAPILNIALTSRNKKAEDETAMCGVPHHSIAGPIGKLLAAGLKVAICDQLEDPELAKGIVKRGVTRVLSPGMVYDPESLAELKANYVAAFDHESLGFLESTTGETFFYSVRSAQERNSLLAVLHPAELLVTSEQLAEVPKGLYVTEFNTLEENWPERFQSAPISAKRLLTYATSMQGTNVLSTLREFERRELNEKMALHEAVLRHLEIFESYRGEPKGSLFHAINRTKTSAGARLLKSYLQFPLLKRDKIEARLNQVSAWVKKPNDLKILRQALSQMGDIERRLAKVSYNNCHVRDLVALRSSLEVGIGLSPLCDDIAAADLALASEVCQSIGRTVVDDPPLNVKNGGFIRAGVDPKLDELILLSEQSEKLLLELEAREREATGISSLKIRYNNVFGYYIEVTNTHKDKVPDHYKRKQTLANAERYVTQDLHELETKILSSRTKRVELEEAIFARERERVLRAGTTLLRLALKWSELDVHSSLAWLAIEQNYTRPEFVQEGGLNLEHSRHPVVEQEVMKKFVPNTVQIGFGDCLLLTGPNMAGKSTLMRQVAVIAMLAQMGSFVPAKQAKLPVFDQIFTRIGASDSLSEGLSTFMVEMRETAEMLKSAGPRTLVVLDEVGRGTSTYDGMSLAQAILEFLVTKTKSMTLFATHYHEITELADQFPQVRNSHMAVIEKGHDIQFLYSLREGPANKSYGIQVARLAGVPDAVVKRALELLKDHEARMRSVGPNLPLLSYRDESSVEEPSVDPRRDEILRALGELNVGEITPLEALNRLAEWQSRLS